MAQQMKQIQFELAKAQLGEAQLENEKTKAEIAKLQAEKLFIDKQRDLEDEKVQIQAANTVIGQNKVLLQKEANKIANKKVDVDKIKARQQPKGDSK